MKSLIKKLNSYKHTGKAAALLVSMGYKRSENSPKIRRYNAYEFFEKIDGGYRLHFISVPGNTKTHTTTDFLK